MNIQCTKQNSINDDHILHSNSILQRKCDCGNKTIGENECSACSSKKNALQRKISIGASNDPLEHEADRVAEQVMSRSSNSAISNAPVKIQRLSNSSSGSGESVPSSVNSVLSSSGSPMQTQLRQDMEQRFGYDFSQVRIHTGAAAEQSAHDVSALAYTAGRDIVFGSEQYAPHSNSGRHLLAHELTHVVQQNVIDTTRAEYEEQIGSNNSQDGNLNSDVRKDDTARKTIQKANSNPILQRAACPCCTESISITDINRIDTAERMGHSFNTNLGLQYPESGPSGSCTLEWWEKTNIPYTSGMVANTWTDMFQLLGGGSFGSWNNRSEECGTSTTVVDTDPPSLARRAGRTAARTLEFRIVINSMPQNSSSGCTNPSQQLTATQVLTMVNGAPDWAASSFTTP